MWNNPITRFAVLFIASYAILNGLYQVPFVSESTNAILRGISKKWMQTTLPELKFNTKADKENGKVNDNKMILEFEWTQDKIDAVIEEARRTGQANIQVPYRFISYLLFEFYMVPLIFLISLIIAIPMQRRTKWIRGSITLGAMLLFLLIKLLLLTLFSVSKAQIDVYQYGHETMTKLQWIASVMTMGFSVIVAFFLWIVIMFPKSELRQMADDWLSKKGLS